MKSVIVKRCVIHVVVNSYIEIKYYTYCLLELKFYD